MWRRLRAEGPEDGAVMTASPDQARDPDFKRSSCPISNALDILGDRWSLLVVRDLLFRDQDTFGGLLDSPEGIATNILAERLKRLEAAGIVEKAAYQDRPPRYSYRLTAKGEALRPVLLAMMRWANDHIPGTAVPPPEALEPNSSD